MSDKEFEILLQNLRKPYKTSVGEKTPRSQSINNYPKESIDKLLKSNPIIWETSLSNELGRLAQGILNVEGNNVVNFIFFSEVSNNCIVT